MVLFKYMKTFEGPIVSRDISLLLAASLDAQELSIITQNS